MKNSPISICTPSLAELEREEGLPPPRGATALFTATQRRLLGLVYGQPDREFHLQELLERTGTGNGAIQRELRRLEAAGLVRSARSGVRKLYCANEQAPHHEQLKTLVQNSFGLVEPLREAFAAVESRTELLSVSVPFQPSLWRNTALELLLVAKHGPMPDEAGLAMAIAQAECRLDRALILPRLLTAEALRAPDEYVRQLLSQPRVWVFGHEAGLRAMTNGP